MFEFLQAGQRAGGEIAVRNVLSDSDSVTVFRMCVAGLQKFFEHRSQVSLAFRKSHRCAKAFHAPNCFVRPCHLPKYAAVWGRR
ncbi:hypothetical protein SAMN04489710_11149 [Paracidovorax konjaci]|uniref:Uncharacterized protein n=1 Tax=Paracidovorax konjaci TaxID=32040 RepID=A0A1I1X0Q3_9BURK|nr:hypothetical protein SAMN04489710_11149 [Paracidovorax konjaci]